MKKGKREQGERKAIGDVSEQLSTVIDMALLGLPRFSSLIRFLNHLSSLPLAWFFYFRFIVREITTWTVFQKRWSFPVSFCAWAFFFDSSFWRKQLDPFVLDLLAQLFLHLPPLAIKCSMWWRKFALIQIVAVVSLWSACVEWTESNPDDFSHSSKLRWQSLGNWCFEFGYCQSYWCTLSETSLWSNTSIQNSSLDCLLCS